MYKVILYVIIELFTFLPCLFADCCISGGETNTVSFSGEPLKILHSQTNQNASNYKTNGFSIGVMESGWKPTENHNEKSLEYLIEKTRTEIKLFEARLKRYLNYGWNEEANETREKLSKAYIKLHYLDP